ncbi:MAG: methyltransferase domain-containing protein [Gammaproteobacteria bacterium]|nr:methyltransferase domain-containing protein [Gammaproteobacteria bacterium]
MGFYQAKVFPKLLDLTMGLKAIDEVRNNLLETITGHVLEIGFGTGRNLPFYPPTITSLTAVDSNPGVYPMARQRIRRVQFPVDVRQVDCSALPVSTARFDCVVSTFTLCSVDDIGSTLQEVNRVLKPDGRLFIAEHGLSPEPVVAKWQHRATPIQKVLGAGCHLNRDMETLIKANGFRFAQLERFYLEKAPKIAGYIYAGIAVKA